MSKNIKNVKPLSFLRRERIFNQYLNRFYNLFMGHYKIEGFDYQQNNYFFRKLWGDGTVALWEIKETGTTGLAPYASVAEYNYLDFPTKVNLINSRGYRFIPSKLLEVDKEVVLTFALSSRLPAREYIEFMVGKIADVETTIRKNLRAHNTPWIIATTPENELKVKTFMNKIDSDDDVLNLEFEEGQKPEALISGAPYIIDRLYQYKNSLVNEVLTYIGINNMGESEKKEHLITSEVNVNNDLIKESGDNLADNITEALDRVNKLFGHNYKLIVKQPITEQGIPVKDSEDGETEKDEGAKDNEQN